ncbi:hypothetical protein HDU96_004210 [Phlyctochytrium bullatum]|nr:hypothetical protein HDU96_004210 [Phlyctochytrium bullatum]
MPTAESPPASPTFKGASYSQFSVFTSPSPLPLPYNAPNRGPDQPVAETNYKILLDPDHQKPHLNTPAPNFAPGPPALHPGIHHGSYRHSIAGPDVPLPRDAGSPYYISPHPFHNGPALVPPARSSSSNAAFTHPSMPPMQAPYYAGTNPHALLPPQHPMHHHHRQSLPPPNHMHPPPLGSQHGFFGAAAPEWPLSQDRTGSPPPVDGDAPVAAKPPPPQIPASPSPAPPAPFPPAGPPLHALPPGAPALPSGRPIPGPPPGPPPDWVPPASSPVPMHVPQVSSPEVAAGAPRPQAQDNYSMPSPNTSQPAGQAMPSRQNPLANDGDEPLTSKPTFRRQKRRQAMPEKNLVNATLNRLRKEAGDAPSASKSEASFELAKFCIETETNMSAEEIEALREEGFKILVRLSRSGMPEAQYYLGKAFAEDGRYEQAYKQFSRAAKVNHPAAMFAAASCLEHGRGVKKDERSSALLYRKAALTGHKLAMYRLGMALVTGNLGITKNVQEGLKWLHKCASVADKDHCQALVQLSIIYEKGLHNVAPDNFKALSFLKEAAKLDYGPALSRLGLTYEKGRLGVKADISKSLELYKRGASVGNDTDSQYALSDFFVRGIPGLLPPNQEQAMYWCEKAAEKDHCEAQFALGYFFEKGIGTLPNLDTAMDWYKKAAAGGSQRAKARLGRYGVAQEAPQQKDQKARGDEKCIIS